MVSTGKISATFRYGKSFEHQTKPALLTSDEAEYDGGTKEKLNASALV